MRRTLTVVMATAALLAPAGAAFADAPVQRGPGFNASCSNGKGGNGGADSYNGLGNTARAAGSCGVTVVPPPGGDTGGGGDTGSGGMIDG